MDPTAVMTAYVKTRLNVTPRMGRASAQRVGQGHIATYRACRGHLARTALIVAHANPAMLRGIAISRRGNAFASLDTQEISMLTHSRYVCKH